MDMLAACPADPIISETIFLKAQRTGLVGRLLKMPVVTVGSIHMTGLVHD